MGQQRALAAALTAPKICARSEDEQRYEGLVFDDRDKAISHKGASSPIAESMPCRKQSDCSGRHEVVSQMWWEWRVA